MSQSCDIYNDLKEKIISGYFKPAENLREQELSNLYKASRNTVKKVLLMLSQDNLVSIENNKGAKVKNYSLEEIMEFIELRSVLEGLIIRRAVEIITDDQVSELEKIVKEMKLHKDNSDLLSYSNCNHQFHSLIYSISPCKYAVEMVENLKYQMKKYNSKTILVPGRDNHSYNEHLAIFKAIKARDNAKSEILLIQHLQNVLKTFKENYSLLFC